MRFPRSSSGLEARYADPLPAIGAFDPDALDALPAPAQRFLRRALPPGTPLGRDVVLEMEGTIKVRGWTPFRAHQLLRSGEGFVWQVVAGRRPMRIVGADLLGPEEARMAFRLWGRIPLVRADGADVARSAAGRLAAEVVCWLPQAVTPQAGARWTPIDDRRATVAVGVGGEVVDVTTTIDDEGRLCEVALERWGDPDGGAFGLHPFGGRLTGERTSEAGVVVAADGEVGWGWGTPGWDDGDFFHFHLTSVRHPVASS